MYLSCFIFGRDFDLDFDFDFDLDDDEGMTEEEEDGGKGVEAAEEARGFPGIDEGWGEVGRVNVVPDCVRTEADGRPPTCK